MERRGSYPSLRVLVVMRSVGFDSRYYWSSALLAIFPLRTNESGDEARLNTVMTFGNWVALPSANSTNLKAVARLSTRVCRSAEDNGETCMNVTAHNYLGFEVPTSHVALLDPAARMLLFNELNLL